MKKIKLLFMLTAVLGFTNISHAQTEAQTLEWLNTKKAELYRVYSATVGYYSNGKLNITNEQLHAYNDEGAFSNIEWNEIKDISFPSTSIIKIISDRMYKGENSFISLQISDSKLLDKYIKALKHMATLKGAKLIDNDLF